MINLSHLRTDSEAECAAVSKKDPTAPIKKLYELDVAVRQIKFDVEQLRAEKNILADQAKSGITQEIREQSIAIGTMLKAKERLLEQQVEAFDHLYLSIPNRVDDQVIAGGAEQNRIVRAHGSKPDFDFPVRNHVELGTENGWLDFEAAARMTGSNFVLYKGDAVKLLYALTMYMMQHNLRSGYQPVLPPYLLNERSLEISGNFPKFKDQVYAMPEDGLFLTPTSEVNITNMYRDHIFNAADLPQRFTAWTSCFRREAGGYGAHERGLIRMHQFEKVEVYSFCMPEQAEHEFETMVQVATQLLEHLGIAYRVVALAAQEVSFSASKTYDIEIWLAGQAEWVEVASISICTDFQARRGKIRYRVADGQKSELVYTLNGSSLAIARLMVAIMENFQCADGTITIPEVLQDYGIYERK